jgi:hypothetical protein
VMKFCVYCRGLDWAKTCPWDSRSGFKAWIQVPDSSPGFKAGPPGFLLR